MPQLRDDARDWKRTGSNISGLGCRSCVHCQYKWQGMKNYRGLKWLQSCEVTDFILYLPPSQSAALPVNQPSTCLFHASYKITGKRAVALVEIAIWNRPFRSKMRDTFICEPNLRLIILHVRELNIYCILFTMVLLLYAWARVLYFCWWRFLH